MARVKGIIEVTGNLKGVSIYTMRGSDQVIMRTKGGPSKRTIQTSESCKALRENGQEWRGCTKTGSGIRRSLLPLSRLADYNFTGALNALCKKIQQADTEHEQGKRHILLSQNGKLLKGFNLNKTNPFDRVFRAIPECTFDREGVSMQVVIPEIIPALHLPEAFKLPYYRLVVTIGVATDWIYNEEGKMYEAVNPNLTGFAREKATEWFPAKKALSDLVIEFAQPQLAEVLTANDSLIFGLGIEYGNVDENGLPVAVKYAGSAKIIGVL
ncbi:MAG: hypothetical protein Q8909_05925 [Bacteroidota bacterium]|nr:hypothetical protein [Bacteroidota bacterium]